MPKVFTSKTQKIGKIGESIAIKYLKQKGLDVLSENLTFKYGEIDILAIDNKNKVHFIEVKSSRKDLGYTCNINTYRPEENMDKKKIDRLKRTILNQMSFKDSVLYKILKGRVGDLYENRDISWQFDLITVLIDVKNKKAKISTIWDLII